MRFFLFLVKESVPARREYWDAIDVFDFSPPLLEVSRWPWTGKAPPFSLFFPP